MLKAKEGLIVIRGAGDLATGVIVRLAAAGFRVLALETAMPTAIRRTVAFSEAVYEGWAEVEGLRGQLASSPAEALALTRHGLVPILVDPEGACLAELSAVGLVDAILAKRNLGTRRGMAEIVLGLGPGFSAGNDVDAVIETNRGHDLGRVIYSGAAEPDTGVPGEIGGRGAERVVHSPAGGRILAIRSIGDKVEVGEALLAIEAAGGRVEVPSPLAGVLRGLIRSGLELPRGSKIADVDPRGRREHCFTVSDKARAVAGGVLEALLALGARPSPRP